MDLLSTDQPNDFDWQRSKAHLMLLSKCRDAKVIEDFERNPMWSEALKEMPKRAIKRMLHDGMLVKADLSDLLKDKDKVSELKLMLKERQAPASGRKDELIRRLVQADSENMKRAADGLSLFVCSARGREIAEQYIAEEDAKRAELEHKVLGLIDQHMFRAASVAVAAYEAEQPLARGVGIDWRNHDPAHDVAILEFIWVSIPKILSGLDEGRLTRLRVAASMNFLLGVTSLAKWLPADLPETYGMDPATASRMFMFHATHKQNIESYRRGGVVKVVQILVTQTSCEACRKIDRKLFALDDVVELPYEHCAHEMGCRCVVAPVVSLPGIPDYVPGT